MDTSSAIVPCLQAARPSENRLFHFGKSSHRRLTDNLFKSLNTEHVSGPIEHLDEPIGVENHSIAGRKFDLFGRRGLRGLDEATEDASARLEQADGAVGGRDLRLRNRRFRRVRHAPGDGGICGLRSKRAGLQRQKEDEQNSGTLYIMLAWSRTGSPSSCHCNPVSATITDL